MKKSKPRRTPQTPTGAAGSADTRGSPAKIKIPPSLLEGDDSEGQASGAPRQEASVGASATEASKTHELPQAYGTGQVLLLARDPHSVYAQWDLTSAQQQAYRAIAAEN